MRPRSKDWGVDCRFCKNSQKQPTTALLVGLSPISTAGCALVWQVGAPGSIPAPALKVSFWSVNSLLTRTPTCQTNAQPAVLIGLSPISRAFVGWFWLFLRRLHNSNHHYCASYCHLLVGVCAFALLGHTGTRRSGCAVEKY